MYKAWSKVMYGVSILNFASLVPECTVTRNILQWDLIDPLRSTVGRSIMRDFSEYVPVVAAG